MIKTANDKIKSKKKEISELESEIKLMQKEIDDNKRIKDTKGECLRPRLMRRSLISFPEFNTLKWIFVALAVVAFIIMLILVGVTPKTIEDLAAALNFNAGLMVWLGAPAIGLIGSILFSIGYIIVNIVNGISINNTRVANHKNFDVSKGREKAEAFFNNIESFLAQKKEKEDALAKHKEQLYEMETYKNKLPAVANNLPMPNELRSTSGIALLLQYIDTGRAYTIQEAINLYYQDVKDANKMKELQKQTEYAQEQMMNSRIAAENSRIAAENSRKMYEAANRAAEASERAADAAQEAAHYERNTYWDNVYYRAQNKNK